MTRPAKLFLLSMILYPMAAFPSMDEEIAHLLETQAGSTCTFVRNDISYSAREFQQHLRSKMSQNQEVFDNTEEFIEKIATRSAVSDSPYVALCNGELKILRDWFTELLGDYRSEN